jgi:hypothetical protein
VPRHNNNAMKITHLLPILILVLPASAQRGDVSTDLTRARAAFNAADRNKDRQLNTREVGLAGIPHKEFLASDDGDGEWSWTEFLLYYRGLLVQSGQAVHADLEKEVTRLRQTKKVKAAKGQGDQKQGGAGQSSEAKGSSNNEALRKKLNEAKRGISERAVAGGATRADQRAVAGAGDKVEKRAQSAGGVSVSSGDAPGAGSGAAGRTQRELLAGKILDAQKTLQRVVKAGRLKPEEARDFYQVFLGRGVNALGGRGSGVAGEAAPSLRERITRLQGILQVHIDSGRVTPAEARNINGILEQRAREAAAGNRSGSGGGTGGQASGDKGSVSVSAGGGQRTLREKLKDAQRRLQQRQSTGGADAGQARKAAESLEERARGAQGAAGGSGETGAARTAGSSGKIVEKKPLEKPAPVKVKKERTKGEQGADPERKRETPL